jgi:general secretion pathway protein J
MNNAPRARLHGFTLLELLIAVAIFALIGALAMGGYNELIKQREHAAETMARTRSIQRAMLRLCNDFEQLEPRPVRNATATTTDPALYYNATGTYIIEVTRSGWTNPAGLPRSTLQRVGYRLSEGKLYRDYWSVLDRNLNTPTLQAELLPKVTSFTLRFMDRNRQWQTTWPATSTGGTGTARARSLPIAVEITLTLEDWGQIQRVVEVVS